MKRLQAILDSAVLATLTGVLLATLPGCAGVSMSQLSPSFWECARRRQSFRPIVRRSPLTTKRTDNHRSM